MSAYPNYALGGAAGVGGHKTEGAAATLRPSCPTRGQVTGSPKSYRFERTLSRSGCLRLRRRSRRAKERLDERQHCRVVELASDDDDSAYH